MIKFPRFVPRYGNVSFSQCGEDLIISFLLSNLRLQNPTYLDVGTNDPVFLNNTYLLYKKGCYGVCVEPNPRLYKSIRRKRPRDKCIQAGVGIISNSEANFYVLNADVLSTFSKEFCDDALKNPDYKLINIVKVPLLTLSTIINENFVSCPNFISIDIEGWDLEIIKTFDFTTYRPEVICVETLTFSDTVKVTEIMQIMHDRDYFTYADTFINTIFVDNKAWALRKRG